MRKLKIDVERLGEEFNESKARWARMEKMLADIRDSREAHRAKLARIRGEMVVIRTKVANLVVQVTYNEEQLEDVGQLTAGHEQRLRRIEELLEMFRNPGSPSSPPAAG